LYQTLSLKVPFSNKARNDADESARRLQTSMGKYFKLTLVNYIKVGPVVLVSPGNGFDMRSENLFKLFGVGDVGHV